MAEMTRRRMGEFVRQTFGILLNYPDGLPAKELLAKLEQSLTLSDFEKSDYPNRPGVRRFEKIVRFATIAPVKAGWLLKSKGKWVLTDDGKKAFESYKDPEVFQRKADELYRKWEATKPGTEIGDLAWKLPTGVGDSLQAFDSRAQVESSSGQDRQHRSLLNLGVSMVIW